MITLKRYSGYKVFFIIIMAFVIGQFWSGISFRAEENKSGEGKKVWEFEAPGSVTPPIFSKGKLYVGCRNKKIYCLDAHSGRKITEFQFGEVKVDENIHSIIVSGDQLYLTSNVGEIVRDTPRGKVIYETGKQRLYCIDISTGKEIWRYCDEKIEASTIPAIYKEKVYLEASLGPDTIRGLLCLDAKTGEKVWYHDFQAQLGIGVVAFDGKIYVPTLNPLTTIYCMDAKTGKVNWEYKSTHTVCLPAISEDCLYGGHVTSAWDKKPSCVWCIDLKTGKERWCSPGVSLVGSLAIDSEQFYGVSYEERKGYSINCFAKKTGEKLWTYKMSGALSFPALAENRIYVGVGKDLICLEARLGKELWKFTVEDEVSSPIICQGKVYFGAGKKIYCLDAGNAKADGWYMQGGGPEQGGYNRQEMKESK